MDRRGGVTTFFAFLFLGLVLACQILAMLRANRLYDQLECLEQALRQTATVQVGPDKTLPAPADNEGDWLVWAFRVEPKTLNQFSAENDVYSRWITVPYIFEPLLVYDYNDLTMQPWLAESYSISKDGLEITFELRDDIHFSDGHPVTSEDVVFTCETAVNPDVGAANIANLFVDVDKAVAVDARVVKFYLKRPYFKALENVSFWDFGILPKHVYQFDDASEFNSRVSEPVGSGPFIFEKWDTGRQVVLARNEIYWAARPRLKKIVYRFISNPAAAVQALRCHEVDVIIPEPDQFAELSRDEEFKKEFYCLSYRAPGTPFYYIGWNQNSRFFKDKRVRRAMTHTINREEIVLHLLKGHGQTITGPFYINGPQYDHTVQAWPYDLARAKHLLDESGWVDTDGDGVRDKNGTAFKFEFMYSTDNVLYERLAKFLKDQAAQVGVEVVPEPVEWSVVISRVTAGNFDAVVMGWAGDILEDAYPLWHSSQTGDRGCNYVGFSNAQADAIIEQAGRTLDDGRRNELYHRLHRILHEQQPCTFLFTRPSFRLIDRRFCNVKVYNLGLRYRQWYVPKQRQRYK